MLTHCATCGIEKSTLNKVTVVSIFLFNLFNFRQRFYREAQ